MVQTVSDSSRYFVIKPTDGPHLGLGFSDRSDSFDLNMALNEHFKSLRLEEEIAKEEEEPREQLDLSLKEGQTIKVNINMGHMRTAGARNRVRSRSPATAVLPPPSAASKPCNCSCVMQIKDFFIFQWRRLEYCLPRRPHQQPPIHFQLHKHLESVLPQHAPLIQIG